MITLEDGTLVLNRLADGDDIQPVLQRPKAKQKVKEAWYVLIRVEDEAVIHWLIDLEIVQDDVSLRYVARNGQVSEAMAMVEELVTAEEGTQCRLKGMGVPPEALMADEPEMV